MGQTRKPAITFLLVILSATIVATAIFLGLWFGGIRKRSSWQQIGNDIENDINGEASCDTSDCSFLWQQIGNDIDGEASCDTSGWSVSLSSNSKILAVGAPLNDGNGEDSGRVRIFQWTTESTSSWTQMGADIDGEASGDRSGWSVSLSLDGKILAVGSPNSSRVRVFQWIESTSSWTQMGADIDGESSGDTSGWSVSLSSNGKILAVGAPDGGNGDDSGRVRIFQWAESTSSWTQMGADIDGESSGDRSGSSVSLSSNGKIVAIGALDNDGNGDNSGHVRIFQWAESISNWTQMGADIDGEVFYDESGSSVSLSSDGKIVAIGAPNKNGYGDNSGRVSIFQWAESTSSWTQMGADIDGEETSGDISGEISGYSVSLSSNGKIVAIGAPYNDGNGDDSGHVRIFQWADSTSTWAQMGADIKGEASGDNSGWSVSLSSDGKTVAIGAPYNGGKSYDSGHVRIFQWKK